MKRLLTIAISFILTVHVYGQAALYAPAATAPGSGGCYTGIGINKAKPDFPLDIVGGGKRINQYNFDRCIRIKGGAMGFQLAGAIMWDGTNITNCTTNFMLGGPGNTPGAGGSLGNYYFAIQKSTSVDSTHLCGDTAGPASFTTAATIYGYDIAGNRPGSFQFYNNVLIDNTNHDGLVGIGTTAPSTQLHTTGGVRFAGLTAGGATRTIVSDANGVLYYQVGTPVSSTCTNTNFVPKTTGVNTLGCSLIWDNGSTVGINTTSPRTYNSATSYASVSGPPVNGTTATLDVNGLTFTNSLVVSSDARFKKNIQRVDNALDIVMKLNGVSYDWNRESFKDRNFDNIKQAGFIAQEVEKVYPLAVIRDDKGYYAMNYNAILPLLTEAVKDINNQLVQEKRENAALRQQINDLCNSGCASLRGSGSSNDASNQLLQNVPNPFSGQTSIGYVINTGSTARLNVNAIDGKLIKAIELPVKGQGTVTIQANEINPGTYTYTLVVDGKVIDTKLMVITSQQ